MNHLTQQTTSTLEVKKHHGNKGRGDSKRFFLIEAAKRLSEQKGLAGWTLKEVATASGVPLGNVYYYFKTKDLLLELVVESQDINLLEYTGQSSKALETQILRLQSVLYKRSSF